MTPDDGSPRPRPVDRGRFDAPSRPDKPAGVEDEAPGRAGQDRDALGGAPIRPAGLSGDGGAGYDGGQDGGSPEEDDDNPDQESDEALPDDEEEHAIRRDMGGEGVRYEPE